MAQHILLSTTGNEGILRKKIISVIRNNSLKANVELLDAKERIGEGSGLNYYWNVYKIKIVDRDIAKAKAYDVVLFEKWLGKEGREFIGKENLGWGDYSFEVFYFPSKIKDNEKWMVFWVA